VINTYLDPAQNPKLSKPSGNQQSCPLANPAKIEIISQNKAFAETFGFYMTGCMRAFLQDLHH